MASRLLLTILSFICMPHASAEFSAKHVYVEFQLSRLEQGREPQRLRTFETDEGGKGCENAKPTC